MKYVLLDDLGINDISVFSLDALSILPCKDQLICKNAGACKNSVKHFSKPSSGEKYWLKPVISLIF